MASNDMASNFLLLFFDTPDLSCQFVRICVAMTGMSYHEVNDIPFLFLVGLLVSVGRVSDPVLVLFVTIVQRWHLSASFRIVLVLL